MKQSYAKKVKKKKKDPIVYVPVNERFRLIQKIITKLYLLDNASSEEYDKYIKLKN